MKVKRFVIFHIESYYPCGGMNDYRSSHDTLEEAEAKLAEAPCEDCEIIDLENFEPNS